MSNERLTITKTGKRLMIVETDAEAASTDIRTAPAHSSLSSESNEPKNSCLHPKLSINVSNYITFRKLYGC